MKKNSIKNKVLIIGPLPPPAGGISIHIERLYFLLKNDFEFDFIDESSFIKPKYFNIRNLNFIGYIIKILNSDLLYIHSGNKLLKKIHILFGKIFLKKIIITFHGFDRKKGKISKVTDHFVYSLVDKIIVVNKEISKDLKLPVNKCVIKPAFLPPLMEKETSIPDYLYEIILKAKSDFKTIISSNASRLNTFNNQDLYGLDMCIDLSVKLKNASFPFLFIFNVSSLDEGIELYQNAQESIKINQLEHSFLLLNEEISFVKLIEQSNVILRTTNTDGDALSIREALYLNKPVIASDIVLRPFGTILFKTRNSDDLFSKFTSVVKSINNTPYNYSPNIYFKNQYKRFYKKLIEKQLCT